VVRDRTRGVGRERAGTCLCGSASRKELASGKRVDRRAWIRTRSHSSIRRVCHPDLRVAGRALFMNFKLEPALALSWQAVRRENLAASGCARREVPRRRPAHGRRRGVSLDVRWQKRRSVHSSFRGVIGARKVDALTVDVLLDAPMPCCPRRPG